MTFTSLGRIFFTLISVSLAGCTNAPYSARFFGPAGEFEPHVAAEGSLFKTLGPVLEGSVQVIAVDAEGVGVSRGSGVVVGPGRYLTARHMTEGSASSWIVKLGGDNAEARCIARGAGPLDDWALLESAGRVGQAVPILPVGRPQPGAFGEVVAVGYALGYPDVTVTIGHIQVVGDQFIRFSAPIIFGNSGGGLYSVVDGHLTLIGITVAVGVGGGNAIEHMGVAVPIQSIRKQCGLK